VIVRRVAVNRTATVVTSRGVAYYTVPEASEILRKSKTWIYRKVRAREIAHHRQDHNIFFTDGDIRDILAAAARPAKKKSERPAGKNTNRKRDNRRPTAPATPVDPQPAPQPRLHLVGSDIPQADPTASRKYRATS
jgi:hypothetical protein